MADFFSQFQVHPPQVPAGPNMGNEGQYSGQFTGLNGGPIQDFNLGGFQPEQMVPNARGQAPTTAPQLPSDNVRPGDGQYGGALDPRLTTQPQPYQQGPTDPWAVPGMWDGRSPYKPSPMPPGWDPGPHDPIVLPSGQQFPDFKMDMSPDKSGWQQPGGMLSGGLGSISNGQVTSGPSYQDMAQMKSGAIQKPGDFYAPPAIAMGPNGGFIDPGTGQPYGGLANGLGQPMNPSQQSGLVLMQSPDGLHMQNVPQAHVAHYTGLGATQVNGQQLSGMTGSSYGGGNG